MDFLDNELLLEVTIAEIAICFIFATIGFTLKELVLRRNIERSNKKATTEAIIVILSATIISVMVNPFVSDYSKRLVALTPFILGVIGMDFIKQILSVNSLFNLITRAFKMFGLFQGREVKDKPDNDEKSKVKSESHKQNQERESRKDSFSVFEMMDSLDHPIRREDYDIDKFTSLHLLETSIDSASHNIDLLMDTYNKTHDSEIFLKMYIEIEKQYNTIKNVAANIDDVPFSISHKAVDLAKKKLELDGFYQSAVVSANNSKD